MDNVIGKRIKSARKRAGMTQTELGKKLGISCQGIGQWETGSRNPKIESLQKIASALSISIEDLTCGITIGHETLFFWKTSIRVFITSLIFTLMREASSDYSIRRWI